MSARTRGASAAAGAVTARCASARPRLQTRLGRRGLDHRLASPTAAARTAAPRRPPARTTRITDSPRTAGTRSQTRLAYGCGSHCGPATSSGSHDQDYRLASDGGAPAPRRPPARTTRITDSPRTAGPQPRDVLRLARPGLQTRLGRRGPSPATSSGSHDQDYRLASDGGAPAPRRPPARTTRITGSPRTAGPQPRDVLRLARPGLQARLGRRGPSPATSS